MTPCGWTPGRAAILRPRRGAGRPLDPRPRAATPNHPGPVQLARKPNYDFEKRRKELERKTKKEEKLRRKREARRARTTSRRSRPMTRGRDRRGVVEGRCAAAPLVLSALLLVVAPASSLLAHDLYLNSQLLPAGERGARAGARAERHVRDEREWRGGRAFGRPVAREPRPAAGRSAFDRWRRGATARSSPPTRRRRHYVVGVDASAHSPRTPRASSTCTCVRRGSAACSTRARGAARPRARARAPTPASVRRVPEGRPRTPGSTWCSGTRRSSSRSPPVLVRRRRHARRALLLAGRPAAGEAVIAGGARPSGDESPPPAPRRLHRLVRVPLVAHGRWYVSSSTWSASPATARWITSREGRR